MRDLYLRSRWPLLMLLCGFIGMALYAIGSDLYRDHAFLHQVRIANESRTSGGGT